MIVSAIAAIGKNNVIGKDNQLFWHLPLEFKYFKETTMGHFLITGRKNFESIGKPLPGRPTIIVTRNKDYKRDDCFVVYTFEDALRLAKEKGEKEVFVTGGAEIYKLSLPYLHRFYRTTVDFSEKGDTYFPDYEQYEWSSEDVTSMEVGENNTYAWKAEILSKKPDNLL